MAITDANVTSMIRSLVGEATAKYWTEAEVTLYKQFGMTKVLGQYAPWLFNKFKSVAELGIVSGTSLYDYPEEVYKISYIQVKATGRKLRYIDEEEYYKYAQLTGTDPIVWTHIGGQIKLIPTPSSTDDDYLYVWYLPNLDTVAEFPDPCRALIAIEGAILARTKNEDMSNDMLILRKEYTEAVLVELQTTNIGDINVFPDFTEDESLV